MRGTIFDSAMRPVVIVLLDPTSDGSPRFFQALVLRRPDLFFLQAAMEPLDGPDFSRTTSPAPLTEFLWSTTISAESDCPPRRLAKFCVPPHCAVIALGSCG